MNTSKRTLYQAALLQSLVLGHYEGFIPVKELMGHGDYGIGTFDSLDGEMVMVDGQVYQVNGRGEVKEQAASEKGPFDDGFYFEPARTLVLEHVGSLAKLRGEADDFINRWGKNYFYGIRIHGTFEKMFTRSEKAQQKPYRRLDEAMKTDQVEFHFENTTGTLIGLYCPAFMASLNMPGWHFHYLSDDRTRGGHVMDLSLGKGTAEFCLLSDFSLALPKSSSFSRIDFMKKLTEE